MISLGEQLKSIFLGARWLTAERSTAFGRLYVGFRVLMEGRQVPWVSARTVEDGVQGNRILCVSLWHTSGNPSPTEQVF